MENRKLVKNFFICILVFFIFPLLTSAYSDTTTHPALTNEIVNLFNYYYPNLKISDQDKEIIKKGSVEEDTPPRWMQHFFDPVYNRGLVLGIEFEKSKDWSQDTLAQAKYDPAFTASLGIIARNLFSSGTDYSWDRAVYECAWGDKQKGLLALGHNLHLLEDATVPEHTRNDIHLPFFDWGSPYESWTSQFTAKNFSLADKLVQKNEKPIIFSDLNKYFDTNALYSNNNFFSKDTTPDNTNEYYQPLIIKEKEEKLSDNLIYKFGVEDVKGKEIKLVRIVSSVDLSAGKITTHYLLVDVDNIILSDYWNLLSEQAVLSGAGAVKLFFDDVEKEKNSKVLLSKNNSFFGKIIAGIGNIFSGTESQPVAQSLPDPAPAPSQESIPQPSAPSEITPVVEHSVFNIVESSAPPPASPPDAPIPPPSPPPPSQPFVPSLPYPGFGGGSAPATQQNSSQPQPDTTPPNSPVISSPADFSQAFTSTTISFSGTAEALSIISNDFNISTTTAGSNCLWSLTLNLNQGSTTVAFFSADAAGNISTSTDVSLFIDSIAPSIDSFSISECSSSFSPDACLVATTTFHLSWQSSASDLDYFELTHSTSSGQAQISTTTATSTTISVSNNSTNTFSLRPKDKSGNWSSSQSLSAEISLMPVVINEVAWAGTGPERPYDEWIELYNRTSRTINLNNWILYSQTDLGPYINLTGSIPSKGYYLIERTDDNTISDILADWKGSFINGLNNAGEILGLVYAPAGQATTTIDQTVLCEGGIGWCPGFDYTYRSMERYDPDISGTDQNNWGTNNSIIVTGKNADNQAINATAKARNSANYLINKNNDLSSNLTLKKSNSSYLVDNRIITIKSGTTLTIEPGVTIKFYNDAGFYVLGKIISQGTASDPIVFTSWNEPNYWYGISVYTDGSVFDYANFRYGGKYYYGMGQSKANLSAENSSVQITNSIFESAKVYGLKLSNSNSTISGSTFQNNNTTDESNALGMLIEASDNVALRANTFLNNRNNLYISNSTTTIKDSVFKNSNTAITYAHSPIKLENVKFESNNLGILADSWSVSQTISALLVEFLNNVATTSPAGLW